MIGGSRRRTHGIVIVMMLGIASKVQQVYEVKDLGGRNLAALMNVRNSARATNLSLRYSNQSLPTLQTGIRES
jgi:hypothetical protein